ncbi:4-(cytidine 5'-diphospho)-2-C-methyl-D-erythritol kinase [Roseateles aquatilis]|uniref:4-diphosphocytidyl-2-C-methyl-D-erythritol kinase n=1 Tax=Roseateles aquatilis TaxID=431061 RepID=A0A246JP98_9BURK|nr:4-(cytidine 5'-diphospho)-2-C-methyl-D-erythritol kinase [Roseateles aquatilis]OWQ93989.1 4-(cytidine 5'-diphospho)-2-C-methyl-D-erythritol kinase [Roseateles aquatilis]
MNALYDVPAPAKLNLFLHVVGKRPDGYHLLQSLFVLVDWADTLHFERRADGALHRHDRGDALPADDLCLRAARALQQASGCAHGVDIHIDKRLPSGAGMGGGSSDAASTLLALNRLWGLNWSRERLLPIALKLGADVPFFVGGRNAFVEGIGEILRPVDVPALRLAVIKPAVSIGTKEIFSSPLLQRSESVAIVAGFPAANDGRDADNSKPATAASFLETEIDSSGGREGNMHRDRQTPEILVQQLYEGWGRNDLQPPAQAASHEVSTALEWLQTRYGNSRMTGSGSAVFARVQPSLITAQETDTVTDPGSNPEATPDGRLNELPPGWVGRMCRSLAVHPLRGWADD